MSTEQAFDLGVLIVRVVVGLTFAAHGYGKLFTGGRLAGTAGWFQSIGMRPGWLHARAAAFTELGAGLLLAMGLLTSVAAMAMTAVMLVAAWTVHRHSGFFIVKNGWEYNLVLATVGISVAVMGPGAYSLDHVIFGGSVADGWWGLLVAGVLGALAGVGQLAIFFRPPANVT